MDCAGHCLFRCIMNHPANSPPPPLPNPPVLLSNCVFASLLVWIQSEYFAIYLSSHLSAGNPSARGKLFAVCASDCQ